MSKLSQRLAVRVAALRKLMGLSQVKLARMANTSQSEISRTETADADPPVSVINALADTFGCCPNTLMLPDNTLFLQAMARKSEELGRKEDG